MKMAVAGNPLVDVDSRRQILESGLKKLRPHCNIRLSICIDTRGAEVHGELVSDSQ